MTNIKKALAILNEFHATEMRQPKPKRQRQQPKPASVESLQRMRRYYLDKPEALARIDELIRKAMEAGL